MSTEFYPLKLSSVTPLNKESIKLEFDVPDNLKHQFNYIQGQHITLKTIIAKQEIRRSYSICSNVVDQKLQVAVKRIDQGGFSNFANDYLKVGMSLDVMPPQGHFYSKLKPTNHKNYLLIAAGSGITPTLSHILSILAVEPQSRVTLIFGNKTTQQMMFKEKLSFIKNEHMNRFNWINLFTEEEQEATLFNGRINSDKIRALHNANIIEVNKFDDVFICGPESMINDLSNAFIDWAFEKKQVHYELFFSGDNSQNLKQKQQRRSQQYGRHQSLVTLKIAGRKKQIELSTNGTNILDAALEQGIDLPFSCKGGVCATCKAKVISGKVEMDANHSLTDQEIADGMVLTCQSHPLSDDVEIDFDFN